MNKPIFKHVKKGDRPSAKEYNKRGDLLANIANSLHIQGIFDGTGFHTRRTPSGAVGVSIVLKIFEVQNATVGADGVYDCFEQVLLAAEWSDTAGDPKFDDKDDVVVEVLNLAEFDPEPTYVAHLLAGALISAWQMEDDEDNTRWVGVPYAKTNAERFRKAYCKDNAGAATAIDCYLDTNGSGTVISVNCIVNPSANLNAATPRLSVGDMILVEKIGAEWWCSNIFMGDITCLCTE